MTPTLTGYGVRLEPLSLDHLFAMALASTDADSWQYMSERGQTEDELREFIIRALRQSESGTTQAWATVLTDPNPIGPALTGPALTDPEPKIIGSTRFANLNLEHRTCELGWTWLAAPFRGNGINPRVKLLQLTYAFDELHLRRVAMKTHHANLRSQRAMLKLGAQYEGTFRNHMLMPDGSSRDTRFYSIIDSEWPAVKARLLERVQTTEQT